MKIFYLNKCIIPRNFEMPGFLNRGYKQIVTHVLKHIS